MGLYAVKKDSFIVLVILQLASMKLTSDSLITPSSPYEFNMMVSVPTGIFGNLEKGFRRCQLESVKQYRRIIMNHNGMGVTLRHTRLITSAASAQGARPLPPDLGAIREGRMRVDGVTAFTSVSVAHLQPFWIDLRQIIGEAAVLISVQGVNPRTGLPAIKVLARDPRQNYYVMPGGKQPWLDGWFVDEQTVAQFVFVDKASGLSVAEHLLPAGLVGNTVSVAAFRPDAATRGFESFGTRGVGQAGKIQQQHATDPNQLEHWQTKPTAIFVFEMSIGEMVQSVRPDREDDGFLTDTPVAA